MQEEKIDSRQLESAESLNVSRSSASLPVQPEKILTKRKAEPTRRILELLPMVGALERNFTVKPAGVPPSLGFRVPPVLAIRGVSTLV
jgi:hypothetical protein